MTNRSRTISPSLSKDLNAVKAEAAGCGNDVVEEELDVEIGEVKEGDLSEDDEITPEFLKQPSAPTAAAWKEHQVLHCPYRCWCPSCVQTRGNALPHRRRKKRVKR